MYKGFGGGADFMMLAACSPRTTNPAARSHQHGKAYRRFYGMSSDVAMEKYAGGVAKYRASEGKEVIPRSARPGRPHRSRKSRWSALNLHLQLAPARSGRYRNATRFQRVTQQINEVYGEGGVGEYRRDVARCWLDAKPR